MGPKANPTGLALRAGVERVGLVPLLWGSGGAPRHRDSCRSAASMGLAVAMGMSPAVPHSLPYSWCCYPRYGADDRWGGYEPRSALIPALSLRRGAGLVPLHSRGAATDPHGTRALP